ncbi:hypothetical protein [Streptomyces sp. NPDC054834]
MAGGQCDGEIDRGGIDERDGGEFDAHDGTAGGGLGDGLADLLATGGKPGGGGRGQPGPGSLLTRTEAPGGRP